MCKFQAGANALHQGGHMSWAKLTLFVLFAAALACGQVLFKVAADSLKGPFAVDARTALQLATNPYLLLGFALYGASAVLWIFLLRDTDLSRAYPVVALALVMVPLLGTFVLGEQLTVRLMVGIAIVILGLGIAFWR